jgi:hypothetical protein
MAHHIEQFKTDSETMISVVNNNSNNMYQEKAVSCQNSPEPLGAKIEVLSEMSFECEPVKHQQVERQAEAAELNLAKYSSHRPIFVAQEFATSMLECRHDCCNCRPLQSTTVGFPEERFASNFRSESTGPGSRINSTSLSHRTAAKDTDSGSSRFQLRSAMPVALRLVDGLSAPLPPKTPSSLVSSSMTKRHRVTAIQQPLNSRRPGQKDDAHTRNVLDSPACAALGADFAEDMDVSSTSPRPAVLQIDPNSLIHPQPQAVAGPSVSREGWPASALQPLPGVNPSPHQFGSISSPDPGVEFYEDSCRGGGDSCSSRADDWMDLFSAWEEDCSVPVLEPLSPASGMLLVLTNAAFLCLHSYMSSFFPDTEDLPQNRCSPLKHVS